MQKTLFIVLALLGAVLFAAQAEAVPLTQGQVSTVCGKGMQSSGSVSGCKKKCGVNGEHDCEYSCYKGKDCQGYCTSCGPKSSKTALFPKWQASRVVRQSVRASTR
jgi:hypothetical protein